MKVAVFMCLMAIPCFLWDGRSSVFLFVLLIGINVRDAEKGSVGSLRISIFKQIHFCFVVECVRIDADRNFVHVLLLKMKGLSKRSLGSNSIVCKLR